MFAIFQVVGELVEEIHPALLNTRVQGTLDIFDVKG